MSPVTLPPPPSGVVADGSLHYNPGRPHEPGESGPLGCSDADLRLRKSCDQFKIPDYADVASATCHLVSDCVHDRDHRSRRRARFTAVALGFPSTLFNFWVVGVLFATGRELRKWSPSSVGRFRSVLGLTVAPMLVGTIFIIVVNQPTPMGAAFLPARLVEGSLWIFAARVR